MEGNTIKQYIISQKIERVKELIIYDELSLTEIAYKLKYSSVAHLSNQFKKVISSTPPILKSIKIRTVLILKIYEFCNLLLSNIQYKYL